MKQKIGVAITGHNDLEKLKKSLRVLAQIKTLSIHVEIIDDGSTDGTSEYIAQMYPQFMVSKEDGNLWWTGGTNLAIKKCLQNGCEYVILLNADAIIDETAIIELLKTAQKKYPAIIASVAVNEDNPQMVWWAGSKWMKLVRFIPIWASQYIFKKGTKISLLPDEPYETSEAHGRGVMIPRLIFEKVGLFDAKKYPQYGSDADFSFRVREKGYKIFVEPKAKVLLDINNSGMRSNSTTILNIVKNYFKYLFVRRNGEALRVWWCFTNDHLRFPDSICTLLFILALNTYRFWCRNLKCKLQINNEKSNFN